jgi:hypothetical protein
VFTARYALSPYIKQIRFVFKGLRKNKHFVRSFHLFFQKRMPKNSWGKLRILLWWPRGLRRGSGVVRFAGITGSNTAGGGHGCLCVVNVVCCQAQVSALGWSLVQRSPTERGVSKCDCEASVMRLWPTGPVKPLEKETNFTVPHFSWFKALLFW